MSTVVLLVCLALILPDGVSAFTCHQHSCHLKTEGKDCRLWYAPTCITKGYCMKISAGGMIFRLCSAQCEAVSTMGLQAECCKGHYCNDSSCKGLSCNNTSMPHLSISLMVILLTLAVQQFF